VQEELIIVVDQMTGIITSRIHPLLCHYGYAWSDVFKVIEPERYKRVKVVVLSKYSSVC